ncbi:hypothetical protein KAU11_07055 [Candidatus Babeliales bacterium]|nr:hypothetical protein [Candidatus Babeliales bacterium]
MAKVNKPHSISSTVTHEEIELFGELDKIITESRAEFIRRISVKEARKIVKKGK